jgi:hypothetical protein
VGVGVEVGVGVGVGVGVWVGVKVGVGVWVGIGVWVGVPVLVAGARVGVTSLGTLQASVLPTSAKQIQKASRSRRMTVLSPGEAGLSTRPVHQSAAQRIGSGSKTSIRAPWLSTTYTEPSSATAIPVGSPKERSSKPYCPKESW